MKQNIEDSLYKILSKYSDAHEEWLYLSEQFTDNWEDTHPLSDKMVSRQTKRMKNSIDKILRLLRHVEEQKE